MGLDQWIKTKQKMSYSTEIAYWRKQYVIQDWMKQLWFDRGNPDNEAFNGVEVDLSLNDLNAFRKSMKGIFIPEYCDEFIFPFIREAKRAIKDGYEVYYICSW